jgi:hypothetical protein
VYSQLRAAVAAGTEMGKKAHEVRIFRLPLFDSFHPVDVQFYFHR